jgi:TubC N-terminal docking domain
MTPEELLYSLRERGVKINAEGDQLRVDAPAGELVEADWTAIGQAKPALLALLSRAPDRPGPDDSVLVIRRLWAKLLGLLPISPRGVMIDLGTEIGVPEIDQEADQLRLLLLTQGDTVNQAIDVLVERGVLARDERGWVRLVCQP